MRVEQFVMAYHVEQDRLRAMLPRGFESLRPVLRFNAELRTLLKAWDDAIAKVQQATPPSLVYEEESRAVGEIRDIFNPEFESIQVNNADVYEQIHDYVNLIAPDRSDIVKLYSDDMPIFDKFGIFNNLINRNKLVKLLYDLLYYPFIARSYDSKTG